MRQHLSSTRPVASFPAVALGLLFLATACGEGPSGTDDQTSVTDTVSAQVAVDRGEAGLVVDVREILRKGYAATTVEIAFPDHPGLDAELAVNAVTGLAVLRFHNDSLTAAEREALAGGVAAETRVLDAQGSELAVRSEASVVLDASGVPFGVATSLPAIQAPLAFQASAPYLLQPENAVGVVTRRVAGLGAETETAVAGESHFTDLASPIRCPANNVAIGFAGHHDAGLSSVRLICALVSGDGTLGSESQTAVVGGAPGTGPVEARCPQDGGAPTILVRDAGLLYTPETLDRIRAVRGFCRRLDEVVTGLPNAVAAVGASRLGGPSTVGDQPYDLSCPDGSLVTGLRAFVQQQDPTQVVRVAYFCRPVNTDWAVQGYVPGSASQRFFFTPVAGAPDPHTYTIRQSSRFWAAAAGEIAVVDQEADAGHFVFEQDPDGWVRVRLAGTTEYVLLESDGRISLTSSGADRFRPITDDITWTAIDRGLTYHQPIMPPTRLDFAYAATIRNCSPATFTETIGKEESRTRTTTASTTESVQLLSTHQVGVTVELGLVYDPPSVTGGVGGSLTITGNYNFTRSNTTTTSNRWSNEDAQTVQVSRERTLEVPAFTAVEAYDLIRTVEDVRIPFTHVFRFQGTYADGTPLTGAEILSQMQSNFVDGVPTAVGPDYVDMGIRGQVVADQLFQAEAEVRELPGGCD